MLKHLLPITDEMFGIEHRQLDIVFAEQIQQRLLALDLRQLAKVTVAPSQWEDAHFLGAAALVGSLGIGRGKRIVVADHRAES